MPSIIRFKLRAEGPDHPDGMDGDFNPLATKHASSKTEFFKGLAGIFGTTGAGRNEVSGETKI